MLFNLGLYYRREMKPAAWAMFAAEDKDDAELLEDLDCIGGLEAIGPATPIKRSKQRTYRYPAQRTKIQTGKKVRVRNEAGVILKRELDELDAKERLVMIKVGVAKAEFLTDRLDVLPGMGPGTTDLSKALAWVYERLAEGDARSVWHDLITRRPPRLRDHDGGPIARPDHLVEDTVSAVARMDGTVLPIQGPPGTGKTYVTAKAIVALLKTYPDARIAVMSQSHAAIANLIQGCRKELVDRDLTGLTRIVHLGGGTRHYRDIDLDMVELDANKSDHRGTSKAYRLVGATKFALALEAMRETFDWIFIDEAGQISLTDALAISHATRNLVLVGDPQQLPQVALAAHPEPANLSCLEWMADGHATLPPDRGIFLPESRRMHPNVCRFISEQVYDGRLTSHDSAKHQKVIGTPFPETGALWQQVPHKGNDLASREEVAEIVAAAETLLAGRWTDNTGTERPMEQDDIIIVAPYNLQVMALEEALEAAGLDRIQVGTVDRFQGKEAAVCLVSMTASTVDDSPRGMEFLLSLNRLNVAISRAKALALVFGSPRLLEARCTTIEQMRLANTLCALYEYSQAIPPGRPWTGHRILGARLEAAEPTM